MLLRVTSYNIHGGTDSDRKPSLEQIIATLKEIDADVVLLQEIDRLLPRSAFVDQFSVIADSLGYMERAFYGRLAFGPCAFGNAILSRIPVQRWQRLPLPSRGGEPRAALGATLGQGTMVWCIHLGLRQDWRETQLQALADAINAAGTGSEEKPAPPVILGGDFNALRSDIEMEKLRNRTGLDDFGEEEPTFPVIRPFSRIDHLMARGFTRRDAGTREDRGSDHRLIWADFELTPLPASDP
jgi:endonuclease/exonuclease/phosphatase family metal-dependent hydrolase